MKSVEKKLIKHLKKRAPEYSWHGFTHRRGASSYAVRLEPGEACYRISLKAIIKGKLLIRLTLVYFASYGYWEEFDQNKHKYWFELKLTDILGITGRKTICNYKFELENENQKEVHELFTKIKHMTDFVNFSNQVIAGTQNNAVEVAIQMI